MMLGTIYWIFECMLMPLMGGLIVAGIYAQEFTFSFWFLIFTFIFNAIGLGLNLARFEKRG